MNICMWLEGHAEERPETVALVHGSRSVSYGELHRAVRHGAAALLEAGLQPGNRVLMFVPMSIELYVHMLAVIYVGGIVAFVDPWVRMKNKLELCSTVQPWGFVGVPKAHLLRMLSPAIRQARVKVWVWPWRGRRIPEINVKMYAAGPDDPALVTFTTGSTGTPKAAMRTHGFLLEQHAVLKEHVSTSADDTDLTILPIFVLHNLALGATSVIADATRPWSAIGDGLARCTTATGSPAFFVRAGARTAAPALKHIHIGGAPCFPEHVSIIRRQFPESDISVVYGSTEAEPISIATADEVMRDDGSAGLPVGKPIPEIRVAILSLQPVPWVVRSFARQLMAPGSPGEICVTGNHVLKAYYRSPEATRQNKINEGGTIWHRTGDAGYVDEQGGLHLLGRVSERIVHRGVEIFPMTAERCLHAIGGIQAGTVLLLGGVITAVVKADATVDLERIRQELPYVEALRLVRRIPYDKRHHAKIDYHTLRKML